MTAINPNYRENSFNPKHLAIIVDTIGVVGFNIFDLILVNTEKLDRETYLLWIKDWKQFYNALSNDIKIAKAANDHRAVDALRIVANTLINARRYARDRRRAIAALEKAE